MISRRIALACVLVLFCCGTAQARNPIRRAFFNYYPVAQGTQIDDLPSNPGHCGVCHFDFDGGGQRNPYGLSIEVGINSGLNYEQAFAAVEGQDADNDGFTNLVEITDVGNFTNTPTLPGFKTSNTAQAINVDVADIEPYLTPAGSLDTTPPVVTVIWPAGGETLTPNSTVAVSWTATDASGIVSIDVDFSDDAGSTWKPIASGLPDAGGFDWFVPNLPGAASRLRVTAHDAAGNPGAGASSDFTVAAWTQGVAPTTLRDFEMPGTQPHEGAVLDDPATTCATCHGGYDVVVEPWANWKGSMMGQTMRDPIFLATMVIAEQDAPASGDLCIRCHSPGGWQEGRSDDTSGGLLTEKDLQGVQCDFCHRAVDPVYQAGVSPVSDEAILDALDVVPPGYGNGQFVTDPDPYRRGPYADAQASHQFLDSDFHRRSDICGTCHDVSNPVFVQGATFAEYLVQDLDAPHPDGDTRNMYPVERTFSEWTISDYADGGVFAPQFVGDKPDGMASTCQDCHMPDISGRGAAGGPVRDDIGVHELVGGNYFMPDIIPDWFPEVDAQRLAEGKARAIAMLQKAATLEVFETPAGGGPGVTVRVTNETGHKLPSGYPEGRRIWINVQAYDAGDALVYESGRYDAATGELFHDAAARIYHIEPGTSDRLAALLGIPAGPSFHFVLNDTVFLDNRIPPRGATIAELQQIQSPVVAHAYADGQYWDEALYLLPAGAVRVEVALHYQSTSKEYVEFLRDANTTNSLGQDLYDAWVAQGRCAPVTMATAALDLTATAIDGPPAWITSLAPAAPNPFNPSTRLAFTLARAGRVSLKVFDERGRVVRTLVSGALSAGEHVETWDGRDDSGRSLASGVYFAELQTAEARELTKMTLVK